MVYDDPPDITTIIAKLALATEETVVTLARSNTSVRRISAGVATSEVPGGSRFGKAVSKAVERFTDGDPNTAARVIQSALGDLILGDANVDAESLRSESIAWMSWRRACHAVLFEAMQVTEAETWNAWLARVRERVRSEAELLGRPVAKLGLRIPKFDDGGEDVRSSVESATTDHRRHAMTVHQAKGREFPTVIFYVPKPHRTHAPCPSTEWWSSDTASEEREIAFVACSRAMRNLALVVHKKTFDALKATQGAFVNLFEIVSL